MHIRDLVLISNTFYTMLVCIYCCVKYNGFNCITVFVSFVHRNISMRILECPPNDRPGYIDEADQFYMHPSSWLLEHFGNSSWHKKEVHLPTHIVLYNVLLPVSWLSLLLSLHYSILWRHIVGLSCSLSFEERCLQAKRTSFPFVHLQQRTNFKRSWTIICNVDSAKLCCNAMVCLQLHWQKKEKHNYNNYCWQSDRSQSS